MSCSVLHPGPHAGSHLALDAILVSASCSLLFIFVSLVMLSCSSDNVKFILAGGEDTELARRAPWARVGWPLPSSSHRPGRRHPGVGPCWRPSASQGPAHSEGCLVFQIQCKLFVFDKTSQSWVERGRGLLRLNDMASADDGTLQSRLGELQCGVSAEARVGTDLFPRPRRAGSPCRSPPESPSTRGLQARAPSRGPRCQLFHDCPLYECDSK